MRFDFLGSQVAICVVQAFFLFNNIGSEASLFDLFGYLLSNAKIYLRAAKYLIFGNR